MPYYTPGSVSILHEKPTGGKFQVSWRVFIGKLNNMTDSDLRVALISSEIFHSERSYFYRKINWAEQGGQGVEFFESMCNTPG